MSALADDVCSSPPSRSAPSDSVASAFVAVLELLDVDVLSREEINAAFGSLARVRSWADSMSGRLTRRLLALAEDAPSMFPEADLATANKSSRKEAGQTTRRAKTLGAVPDLDTALAAGDISAEHVDTYTRAIRRLRDPKHRDALAADGARLAAIAAVSTPEQFDTVMKIEVDRLDRRSGETRSIRQKGAIGLRSWTDKDTGMVHITARYDPESGLLLLSRIDATSDTLFHDALPEHCPDGDAKFDHLRALALLALVEGRTPNTAPSSPAHANTAATDTAETDTAGTDSTPADSDANVLLERLDNRCEMIIVIDLDTLRNGLHNRSIIDNGYDIDLPIESYRRMACNAALIPIVLDTNGVAVDQGRSTRLANRAQRRHLRAMLKYPGFDAVRGYGFSACWARSC